MINIEFLKIFSSTNRKIRVQISRDRSQPPPIRFQILENPLQIDRIDIFFFSRRIWKIVVSLPVVDALVSDSRNRNEFQRKIQRIGVASRRRQPTKIIARSMVSPAFLSRWKFTRPHIPRGSKSTPFPNRASSRFHAFSKLLLSPPPHPRFSRINYSSNR